MKLFLCYSCICEYLFIIFALPFGLRGAKQHIMKKNIMKNKQAEKVILDSYTLQPNEQVVLIENFDDRTYKTYAVYVNGEYDRRINVRKF